MPQLVRSLEREVGSVSSVSASGNPFQPTLFYRGFAASPLQGTPQGLAVYLNGMRFNQPFGDTVYWDLIPDVAIDSVNLYGSNPVFGLNALGGSINVKLKNGFTFQGVEAAGAGGSFGHIQGDFQFGHRSGNVATYMAGSALHQNGWRDLQTSDISNAFADIGWRGSNAELHFNVTAAQSSLNGPGTAPVQLLAVAPRAQFTSPNLIANTYAAANLSGNVDLSDTLSIQALAYYRYFRQKVVNGNATDIGPCQNEDNDTPAPGPALPRSWPRTGPNLNLAKAPADAPALNLNSNSNGSSPRLLCSERGPSTTTGGVPITDFLSGGPYSQLDTQNTSTNAYGASLQLTSTGKLFGRDNHFVVGASLDIGRTRFNAASFLGGLTSGDRDFVGPGVVIDEPGSIAPVSVAVDSVDWGIYLANTWRVTPQLALTASGRLNISTITLNDLAGGDINGSHNFVHFNPAGGFTYEFAPWLTVYGGYAVANRTPTPAELSCAGPTNSCSLANFFVGDPPLNQVVSRTFEAGLRGNVPVFNDSRLRYSLALYRSDVDDDIAFINSTVTGRAFFANVGSTRRQGLDAELKFTSDRWLAYLNYSFIDATFQSTFVQASGDNPAADPNGNITVQPGNRLPGIPSSSAESGSLLQGNRQMDRRRQFRVHRQRLPVRRRFQSGGADSALRHARSHDDVPAPSQCPALRLGAQCDEQLVLQLRHVLANVVGGDLASAGRNRHAELQSRCANHGIRRPANQILIVRPLRHGRPDLHPTVSAPAGKDDACCSTPLGHPVRRDDGVEADRRHAEGHAIEMAEAKTSGRSTMLDQRRRIHATGWSTPSSVTVRKPTP